MQMCQKEAERQMLGGDEASQGRGRPFQGSAPPLAVVTRASSPLSLNEPESQFPSAALTQLIHAQSAGTNVSSVGKGLLCVTAKI